MPRLKITMPSRRLGRSLSAMSLNKRRYSVRRVSVTETGSLRGAARHGIGLERPLEMPNGADSIYQTPNLLADYQ
jgi:hypothetical protein